MNMVAQEIELSPLTAAAGGTAPALQVPPPFLKAVKVKVTVRVGQAELSVGELLETRQGGVLALDRLVDQPLDVLVDEHVVARGTLVAVGDHFGVRLTEAPSMSAPAAGVRP
jgi:flagellar motor switch protein FliN/FliY